MVTMDSPDAADGSQVKDRGSSGSGKKKKNLTLGSFKSPFKFLGKTYCKGCRCLEHGRISMAPEKNRNLSENLGNISEKHRNLSEKHRNQSFLGQLPFVPLFLQCPPFFLNILFVSITMLTRMTGTCNGL
jgi:hypothetical protein